MTTNSFDAHVTENNGGGLTLWIDVDGECVFAHSGYEFVPGQLRHDLRVLMTDGFDVSEWDGNEIDTLDYDDHPSTHTVAFIKDGTLTINPHGAASHSELL